jgi:hypothetical protein
MKKFKINNLEDKFDFMSEYQDYKIYGTYITYFNKGKTYYNFKVVSSIKNTNFKMNPKFNHYKEIHLGKEMYNLTLSKKKIKKKKKFNII